MSKHGLPPPQLHRATHLWERPAGAPRHPAGESRQALLGRPLCTAGNTDWAVYALAHTQSHMHMSAHVPQRPHVHREEGGPCFAPGSPPAWRTPCHQGSDQATSWAQQSEDPRETQLHPPPGGSLCAPQRAALFQMRLSKNIPFLYILTPRPRALACFRRET